MRTQCLYVHPLTILSHVKSWMNTECFYYLESPFLPWSLMTRVDHRRGCVHMSVCARAHGDQRAMPSNCNVSQSYRLSSHGCECTRGYRTYVYAHAHKCLWSPETLFESGFLASSCGICWASLVSFEGFACPHVSLFYWHARITVPAVWILGTWPLVLMLAFVGSLSTDPFPQLPDLVCWNKMYKEFISSATCSTDSPSLPFLC